MDNSATVEAQKGLAGAQMSIAMQIESNNRARQDREKRRQDEANRHHEVIHQAQLEAASQRNIQINNLTGATNDARRERELARQNDAEKLSKLETKGKEHQDKLEADQQTTINDMKERGAEQAAEQRERLNEQMHSQRQGMAAQDNAHQQIMVDTKSAFNEQKLKQNTVLETKKLEVNETKDLYKDEESYEKDKLDKEERALVRKKLAAQKDQISMQIKYLNFYQIMCNTNDAEQYYNDARDLNEKCQEEFLNDYKKVSDQVCNSTMFSCEQALRDLDIGRSSITSRAVESLRSLSHGLAKNDREEFLKVLYNLEDAENELRKLCEQMETNVKYRSSLATLKTLTNDINEAMENLRKRIRDVPTEDSVANARKKTEELTVELGRINDNLHDPMKSLPSDASNAQPALK